MVRAIFSDFDETLLNYHSDKNFFDNYQIGILRKLNEKNIEFCIVTGRCVSFFRQFPELLEYVSYILASNGSCIYDVKNEKFIYHKCIGTQEVNELIDYAHQNQFYYYLNVYGNQYYESKDVDLSNCEQFILSFSNKDLERVLDDTSHIPYISFNNICKHGDRYTIDINHYIVSKGNSITVLCKYLDILLEDTVCFGDSYNDVSMFKVVGNSISVGNALEKVKILANKVTLSSAENGVFKYIEDHFLR